MAPKTKVLREDIIDTAVQLVRLHGDDALNARSLASGLKCSTQPIFSNFESMDDVKNAVIDVAYKIYGGFLQREIESGNEPVYKASGMGYIRFAMEESNLFKLLYMRDRRNEKINENNEETERLISLLMKKNGLSHEDAKLFHLQMWIFVHGIATMFATHYIDCDWDIISKLMSYEYLGAEKAWGIKK